MLGSANVKQLESHTTIRLSCYFNAPITLWQVAQTVAICCEGLCVLQQYWTSRNAYEYVSVMQFSKAYQNSPAGRRNAAALAQPFDKALHKKEALVHEKRALSGPIVATCLSPLSSCIAFSLCHVGTMRSHSAPP